MMWHRQSLKGQSLKGQSLKGRNSKVGLIVSRGAHLDGFAKRAVALLVFWGCVLLLVACSHQDGRAPVSGPTSGALRASVATRADAMDAGALQEILLGKTHYGDFGGSPYVLYFAPEGKVSGSVGSDAFEGTWEQEGDTFCITWNKPAIPRGCSWIAMESDGSGRLFQTTDNSFRCTLDRVVSGRPKS